MDRGGQKESYVRVRPLSKSLYSRACQVMPGGISHSIRHVNPFPFYVQKAEGPYIYDVDGHRYIDFWMGHYAHILGHAFPPVVRAVQGFISQRGYHFGLVHREEVELAERVVAMVPCAESVRFCASGTEAGMYASRLARAYTGRKKVLKVMGGWHGASTDLTFYIHPPFRGADSEGLPFGDEDVVIPVPFNDVEGTLRAMDEAGEDLAALIMEPMIGAGGFVPPCDGYLGKVKEELEKRGALLIFDEVITGFRLALGGAQEYWGVIPHLATLGKILGGGFPLGAVVGPKEIMILSDGTKGHPRVFMGGGTFSCSPLSMAAGLKALGYLEENVSWLYPLLEERGEKVRSLTRRILSGCGVGTQVTGVGSLFMVHFPLKGVDPNDPAALAQNSDQGRYELYRLSLLNRGVFVVHGGGALSLAHNERVLEDYFQVLSQVVQEIAP
jgi:glutamate-1-semialdehyde 2,1-aminomutase